MISFHAILFIEITTVKYRGKLSVILNVGFPLGMLLGWVLCYYILNDIDTGNWQRIYLLSGIPNLLISPLMYLFIHESPRYLLVINKT